jgi:hypothetical protein
VRSGLLARIVTWRPMTIIATPPALEVLPVGKTLGCEATKVTENSI